MSAGSPPSILTLVDIRTATRAHKQSGLGQLEHLIILSCWGSVAMAGHLCPGKPVPRTAHIHSAKESS